jgi:ATP-binding cassette subfamily C protein
MSKLPKHGSQGLAMRRASGVTKMSGAPVARHKNEELARNELAKVRRASRYLFLSAFVFSIFVNLLMLAGPLYMMQIYDRVLGSRSVETLFALTLLLAFLFLMMGILDYARGRLLANAGARFQAALDGRVFSAVLRRSTIIPNGEPATGLRDLEAVQRLLSSPALLSVFDLPWTPFFLLAIFIFHPWLGILAISGGAILIAVTVLNQMITSRPQRTANSAMVQAEHMSEQLRNESETLQSLGMQGAAFNRWQKARGLALEKTMQTSDSSGFFTTLTRTLRLFLQSAILGLGAYLTLKGQLSPGAMIAASILMGRALQPVDSAIAQWPMVQRAVQGWRALIALLSEVPSQPARTPLPRPSAKLQIQAVTVFPPGQNQPALRGVTAQLTPGQAMGVIGQSGAGKSTLARAITGVWHLASGKIRLDGASLDQYPPDILGSYIGYLPQRVTLFDGTISDNIARLSENPDPTAIVTAAKAAAAHDMILHLPDGYNTRVGAASQLLSGGQVQRIGLARALYGDPVLLVLDEPNSNLDNEGSAALNAAIKSAKARGAGVIIMAHRPAAIQECDTLLVLDHGAVAAFGPRDDVLRKTVKNFDAIARGKTGGVQ